ncbi:MAG TPA: hypothetical protein VIZ60_10060 [Rubrobacter sp.]
MSAEPILIGADVGTTNIKVVALDRSGRAVESASSPTPPATRARAGPITTQGSCGPPSRRPCAG